MATAAHRWRMLPLLLAAPSSSLMVLSRGGGGFRSPPGRLIGITASAAKVSSGTGSTGQVASGTGGRSLPPELAPITMGVFSQMLGEGIAMSSLPLYLTRLGAEPLMVGVAISCFSVAQMTFAPIMVELSSKIGRSLVLRICLAGAAASSLVIALSGSVYGVVAGRTLAGIFAASVPVAQSGVTDILPRNQASLGLSRVSAASQLGVVVGPAVSALFQTAFAAAGMPSARCLPAVFVLAAAVALSVLAQLAVLDWRCRRLASVASSTCEVIAASEMVTHTHTHIHTYTHTHAYTHTYTRAHIHTRTHHTYIHTNACKRAYTPTYTHIHIHASEMATAEEQLPQATEADDRASDERLSDKGRVGALRLAQPTLRLISVIIGWTAVLSNSIYGLFAPRFLGFGQPQLSATYSVAAALMITTQLGFPRLVARIGEHRACSLGILATAAGIGGQALLRVQPLHSLLYMLNRVGAAVADTATAALVARSSTGREERSRNLALLTSTRAAARIASPLISSKMLELSCRGSAARGIAPPGALPFVTAACFAMAAAPLPMLLQRGGKGGAGKDSD